jgi:prephenate dehydratase
MKAAFQGVHGAYSEVAARTLLGKHTATMPCDQFSDVFNAVESGRASCGIVPIENSLAGSIHQNYDLLLAHKLHIVGEFHLRIEHVLAAHPTATVRSLRLVRSHPQALAQCSKFLERHPHLHPEAYFDTAGAALSIKESGARDIAAIASSYAAELYGLTILRRNLENERHNFTRFLLISRKPWQPKKRVACKCSIAFRPITNIPGILFRILGVFSLRDIDLLKIESRPDPRSPFEYLFYIDLVGSPRDARVTKALDHLQEVVTEYRLLGVYPMGKGTMYGTTGGRATLRIKNS